MKESLYGVMNTVMPDEPVAESLFDHVHRGMGHEANSTIVLNGDQATANVNVFQLTGSVEVTKIYGIVADTSTFANCTAAHFNLYDSAADVDITKNDGVLSGLATGTVFLKNAVAATTFAVADNANGALTEPAAGVKAFIPFVITQKTGQNTYVRFTYTTTDNPMAATATIYCEYRRIGTGTLVVV